MPVPTTVVKASVVTDATGVVTEVPALVTPYGVLEPLLDYFLARRHDRSLGWMRKGARAVRLFVEYLSTNPGERENYRLFLNFAQRLYTGTLVAEVGEDPSGLGWKPMPPTEARKVVSQLNDFFDYLTEIRPGAARFNPRYAGSAQDRMLDEVAYQYRRDKAFLGHTWATSVEAATNGGRLVRPARNITVEASQPPSFPDEQFARLLTEGFRVGSRYDYRGMLITVLQHCAGFRESEPFHLYISDVVPDPANPRSALVLIPHPSEGAAPPDPRWVDSKGRPKTGNRRQYLQERWGLKPRSEVMGPMHAGWKGGIHERDLGQGYYYRAYWFEPFWGEFFMTVWQKYMEEVALMKRDHPFAFVNTDRGHVGEMYKLGRYNKAHAAAIRRIGLEVSKRAGTTPHGHRHAYGQRLREAKVDKQFIRRFMHHSSLSSQDVYTTPPLSASLRELEAASQRLASVSHKPALLPVSK